MKKIALVLIIVVTALTMNAGDNLQACFTVSPKMSCANCENKIKNNLRFEKGIKSITASAKEGLVTIVYDSEKTNINHLISGFKKIGYSATVTDCKEGKKSSGKKKEKK